MKDQTECLSAWSGAKSIHDNTISVNNSFNCISEIYSLRVQATLTFRYVKFTVSSITEKKNLLW